MQVDIVIGFASVALPKAPNCAIAARLQSGRIFDAIDLTHKAFAVIHDHHIIGARGREWRMARQESQCNGIILYVYVLEASGLESPRYNQVRSERYAGPAHLSPFVRRG
ncbi:hypothetical protein [Pelagibacterium sp.]|uniref:hypothetical protein n=1 Tax=Pelagibacterium sp. TaxID=1967288 RepID=UPI003A93B7CF